MEMQHSNWIAQANEHWQEHRPKMYARLKAGGTLSQALTEAAEATAQAMRALTTQGATQEEAWEQTRELYLFPIEEPEQAPKTPKSQGYLARAEVMKGWASLGEPED